MDEFDEKARPGAGADGRGSLIGATVDALEGLSGVHAGMRRAHAKGICCRAVFRPSGRADSIASAPHLRGAGTEARALVRFSGSSSDPSLPDILSPGKGMAVRFGLPGGEAAVLTAVTLPVFFARTPEAFLELVREANRLKAGGLGALAALPALAAHLPEARHALAEMGKLRPPASYAACRYYAIHVFWLVDEKGRRRPVKFEWVPEAGEQAISPLRMASLPEDELELELAGRLARGPARLRLDIVLGREGDPTDDPTLPWPDDRERVDAGELALTGVVEEPAGLLMDPAQLGPGIEPSDDPVLRHRGPVYRESLRRRRSEL